MTHHAPRPKPAPACALPAPLSPHLLSLEALAAVDALLAQGQSPHTRATQKAALAYWHAWFSLRYRQALTYPVPVAAAMQFVIDHVQRESEDSGQLLHELPDVIDQALVASGHKAKLGPLALGTVLNRLSALSRAHEDRSLLNPCHAPELRALLKRTRRAYRRRGEMPRRCTPLARDALDALLATCDAERLIDKRDRALLLFAWSGGRRRSEVASADMRWLTWRSPAHFDYELRHSKGNPDAQEAPENFKPLVEAAAHALTGWLQAACIHEGAIFRSVTKAGVVGGALSPKAVRLIVLRRCKLAGLAGRYTAHSLRAGFATGASAKGIPLPQIMGLTGHRTYRGFSGYVRPNDGADAMRRLLGDGS